MSSASIVPESPLCLGSASPRRRELLRGLGLPLRIVVGEVDEEPRVAEHPEEYMVRVVRDKLAAIANKAGDIDGCSALLVADTIVRIDNRVIGKPSDRREALELLKGLVGREHIVHTRYAVSAASDFRRPLVERMVTSKVFIRSAPSEILERYANTGEGLDKAGAYAVQGIGAFLVERIEGSYSNVVGLPVCEVVADLMELGLLRGFP